MNFLLVRYPQTIVRDKSNFVNHLPMQIKLGIPSELLTIAYQVEAMYNYQKAILNGYVEVSTELSNINNLDQFYKLKTR